MSTKHILANYWCTIIKEMIYKLTSKIVPKLVNLERIEILTWHNSAKFEKEINSLTY